MATNRHDALPRAVFDSAPVPTALLDESLRLADANPAFTALLPTRLELDDVLGLSWNSVASLLGLAGARNALDEGPTASPALSRNPEPGVAGPPVSALTVLTAAVADTGGGRPGLLVQLLQQFAPSSSQRRLEHRPPQSASSSLDSAEPAQPATATSDAPDAHDAPAASELDRREQDTARAVQGALLTELPRCVAVQLAARYLTPTGGDSLGGDWYDALVSADGRLTVTIGDVMGHDLAAAELMGQFRTLLRALVVDRGDSPSDTLARLDRALNLLGIDTLATRAMLTATPQSDGGWSLQWSNAGHPAPLLIHPDGTTSLLDEARSLLLGYDPDRPRRDAHRTVPAGTTLLLYTDGLIETRSHDLDHGKTRLRDSVTRHAHLPAAELLDAVITDMLDTDPADDVAMLAARFGAP